VPVKKSPGKRYTKCRFFVVSMLRLYCSSRFIIPNDGKHGWSGCSLAVPSRLTLTNIKEHPLQVYRVALKDVFDLEGVKTSMCNCAYLELYPQAMSTAPSLHTIIGKGASVWGKAKLSSFLSKEEVSETVDFQTP
jgi:hypothetical protein